MEKDFGHADACPKFGFMKYVRLSSKDPYYNLAVEEYLLKNTKEEVFMLWQNDPTVVIGKNQNAYAEVDLAYAEAHGIRVSRRLSGGGAVYHDAGNINYTFLTSATEEKNFAFFARPIIAAFADLGVTLIQTGRNDLECEGKKVSGTARCTAGDRILHHGTLLFDVDMDTMTAVLHPDAEKYRHRAIASHSGRVGALSRYLPNMSVSTLMDHIEAFVLKATEGETWEVPACDKISALAARNASPEWILSDKRYLTEYSTSRKKKYPFGLVRADLDLLGDTVERIRISGDFFALAPIEELESALVGYRPGAPLPINPEDYIAGFAANMLISLLCGDTE